MDLFDLIKIGLFLLFIVSPIMKSINKKGKNNKPRVPKAKTKTAAQSRAQTKTIVRKSNDEFNARLEEARRRVQEAMEGKGPAGAGPVHSQSHRASQHQGSEAADELFHGRTKAKHVEMPDGFSQTITTSKHQNLPKGIGGRKRLPTMLTGQTVVTHQNLPTGMSGQLSQANHQALSEGLSGHMSNNYSRPESEVGLDRLEQHRSEHVKFKQHTKNVFLRKQKKPVKLKTSVVNTDAQSIVNGIIWHQILSEPKYKKPWRK